MRTLGAVALAGAAVVAAGVVPAHGAHPTPEPPLLVADATQRPFIDLWLAGRPGQPMYVSEQEGAAFRSLAAVALDPGGHRVLRRAERWRCDRRNRRFVVALSPGGALAAQYGLRTPSCRRRLSVGLARRARLGAQVRVVVRDRWRIGDLRLRFCVDAPATGPRRCRPLNLARDRASVSTKFRVGRRGRGRTGLHGPGIRVPGAVNVGEPTRRGPRDGPVPKVLVAGDSMVQGLDGFLSDRLGSRAQVYRDVFPASGISKPGFSWLRRASERGRQVRPDATVIFLGANEGFDMAAPSGQSFTCCSPGWLAEYRRRVQAIMRSYGRDGEGRVFWLSMPQVRPPERQQLQLKINAEIRQAARGLPGVRLVRLDQVFTPRGRYRNVMTYRGRRVRVREADGIHLTPSGAEIAAGKVFAALRSSRVIR